MRDLQADLSRYVDTVEVDPARLAAAILRLYEREARSHRRATSARTASAGVTRSPAYSMRRVPAAIGRVASEAKAGHFKNGMSRLLEVKDLRAKGITTIRTMVRRNDVPVLTFFRTNGFAGSSFGNTLEPHSMNQRMVRAVLAIALFVMAGAPDRRHRVSALAAGHVEDPVFLVPGRHHHAL